MVFIKNVTKHSKWVYVSQSVRKIKLCADNRQRPSLGQSAEKEPVSAWKYREVLGAGTRTAATSGGTQTTQTFNT